MSVELARQADYVFAMTRGHVDAVLRLAPDVEPRVQLLLGNQEVSDPIGGSLEDYERCAESIERGLRKVLPEITL